MNVKQKSNSTTFSMITCQLLENRCNESGMSRKDFFHQTSLSQPTWSRITRGQSKLTLEDLRDACRVLKLDMGSVVMQANIIADQLPKKEHVNVVVPDGSQVGGAILAMGALAFLVARLLK